MNFRFNIVNLYCFTYLCVLSVVFLRVKCNDEFCDKEKCNNSVFKTNSKYVFYDINPPEGFNLRRDVYLRYAIFAHKLNKSKNDNLKTFKLVLPPWSHLVHWKYENEAEKLPWSLFFDLPSLQLFAPVIEMYQFFDEIERKYSRIKIDEVYTLQHFQEMFESGHFEDKMAVEICQKQYKTTYFFYSNITSDNVKCLSFHGHTSQLSKLLETSSARTILFDHAEVALHDRFGDKLYWQARRSMRFNKNLRNIANEYRNIYLNSTDENDNTVLPDDWRNEKLKRNALGGSYLSVHLRRKDFVWGRASEVPSIESAAKQIKNFLEKLNLNSVFIATDAPPEEFEKLESLLLSSHYKVYKYRPEVSVQNKYKNGGVAIIEQIICSYARYFVGTYESTFTFRIQEEREILGFPEETTFNRLCGDNPKNCQKPSMWKIVH